MLCIPQPCVILFLFIFWGTIVASLYCRCRQNKELMDQSFFPVLLVASPDIAFLTYCLIRDHFFILNRSSERRSCPRTWFWNMSYCSEPLGSLVICRDVEPVFWQNRLNRRSVPRMEMKLSHEVTNRLSLPRIVCDQFHISVKNPLGFFGRLAQITSVSKPFYSTL